MRGSCKRSLAALKGASYDGKHCILVKETLVKLRLLSLLIFSALTACGRGGEFEQGGVYITRSACPIVGVPAATGDVTLFNPPNNRTSDAIDVTATITNVYGECTDQGGEIMSNIGFDVVAVRRDAGPARQVVLPYFNVVVRGGSEIVAKRIGRIALNFEAGSQRAATRGQAVAKVSRAAASLPRDVRAILTRERKPGEAEAAVDPLSDPAVAAAVSRATFEHLIGFQMSQDLLRYNATR
jgi:hypothetical protein